MRHPHALISDKAFVTLVTGQAISLFGNATLRFALSMWILDVTGSATLFASILAAAIVPTCLLMPLAGTLVDRVNRRTIMVTLDALSALLTCLAALWLFHFGFSITVIVTLEIALACLSAFETPTVQAALPQLLRAHGDQALRRGMTVVNQIQQLGTLIPSFLGGTLYAFWGATPLLTASICCFAIAAGIETTLRLPPPAPAQPLRISGLLDDMRTAIRFATTQQRIIMRLMATIAIINFLIGGFSSVGFPYSIRTLWGFGAGAYGISEGLVGLSNLLGAFAAGIFIRWLTLTNLPRQLLTMTACMAPSLAAYALPADPTIRLILLTVSTCLMAAAAAFSSLTVIPTVQLRTPDHMTGKIMALLSTVALCSQPLAQIVYGWAYDTIPPAAITIATMLILTMTAVDIKRVVAHA